MRFGFELWCITSTDGYLLHAQRYCDSDTILGETGLAQEGNVVIDLIKKYVLSEGCTVTFDNLFTSLPFPDELSELRIGGCGTLCQNRVQNDPVQSKLLKKED